MFDLWQPSGSGDLYNDPHMPYCLESSILGQLGLLNPETYKIGVLFVYLDQKTLKMKSLTQI
jgi:hypothetical protein